MAQALMIGSAVTSYMGAKQKAAQYEINAQAALQKAKYDAAVAFNNALGKRQELGFQQSVTEANRNRLLKKSSQAVKKGRIEEKQAIAAAKVRYGYGGTFTSYVDSLEMSASEAENDLLLDVSDQTTSASLQLTEFSRQQNTIKANAEATQRNILYTGQTQANSLRAQARQEKIAGFANMLGGFAQAAAMGE